ncbi:unnamed protein product [Tilletia controversa]|uniref:Uncharacterized protein n=1 Tax=Tilletia laevis TaxID=157183 RepID=A0A9N8MA57_9BASI|nr:unnamed protein product [Tilletia controversa]CAD6958673.1 unnamed protein product [Tilletia laevis]CAD6965686.1 unnamed protein product [Tilletia laevis]CAD7066376.1 unnamed protein product [Tilletia caries]
MQRARVRAPNASLPAAPTRRGSYSYQARPSVHRHGFWVVAQAGNTFANPTPNPTHNDLKRVRAPIFDAFSHAPFAIRIHRSAPAQYGSATSAVRSRGTVARNLPKDHAEASEEASPALPAQATQPEPAPTASSSRKTRVRTTSVAEPSTSALPPAKTPVAPTQSSPSRTSSKRSAAVAAAASAADTTSELPQSQAESSTSQNATAPSVPVAQRSQAPSLNIRKIVLKRKRDEPPVAVQEEVKPTPTPEPIAPRSKPRTRARAESVVPPQASTSAVPVALPSASESQQGLGTATSKTADTDGDDEEAEADDDDDGGDEDDQEDGEGDGEGEAADGTVTTRKYRIKRPPKLDADGNPIPRKRGERGKRLKPGLRDIEEGLKGLKNPEGGHFIDFFLELPSAEDYPDYYKHIAQPISLKEIDLRLKKKDITYQNPYSFVTDLRLMFSNAKFYNEDGSPVWSAADALEKHMDTVLIPQLLSHGFTLEPNDMRKTVLPRRRREPKAPKPPRERKITKAERREMERRAQAEEAARLAAEQAAAATGGMAAIGEGLAVSMPDGGMLSGVPSYLAPPGAVPGMSGMHHIPQMGYPNPAMPMHSSPYASAHIPLPNIMPQQHVQQPTSVFSPHGVLGGQIINASPSSTGMMYHHQQHHPQLAQHLVPHGISPAASGTDPSYFPIPVPGSMAAPAPPGAFPHNMAHDPHAVNMGIPAHSSLVHPHPPIPSLSYAGSAETGVDGFGGPAAQAANALKARELPGINPYSPPTILGVRRPPVIPLVGVDVTLAAAIHQNGKKESNKKYILPSTNGNGVATAAGGGDTDRFRKDLRILVDNWVTHQHAITLPPGVEEVRIRFRTSAVTTKHHARHSTTAAGTALVGPNGSGTAAEEDRKQRVSWRWKVRTLVNGVAANGEWKDEDEIAPPKKRQRKAKEGVEGATSADAMDVDVDAAAASNTITTRRSANGRTTTTTTMTNSTALNPSSTKDDDDKNTSAQICTLRFRPQRGTNIIDLVIDGPSVPSARIERLLDQDEVKFDDEMRARVLALKNMEEKYRLFIMVP